MSSRVSLVLVSLSVGCLLGWAAIWARDRIEGPDLQLEPSLFPTEAASSLSFGPQGRPTGPCRVCGGDTFQRGRFCLTGERDCFITKVCGECGALFLPKEPRRELAVQRSDGQLELQGEDGRKHVGDSAIASHLNDEGRLGVQIDHATGGRIVITGVFPGTLAEKAGMKSGDFVHSINGVSIEGRAIEDVARLLRVSPGSEVHVEVVRGERTLRLTASRP